MTSLPIGRIEQKTPEGFRKYVLIIPEDHHNDNFLMICLLEAVASKRFDKDSPEADASKGSFDWQVDQAELKATNNISLALQERKRLQDIGLPYTAIVAEDGIEFVEGTMETLESDVLEQQWFSDIELALAHSNGIKYLSELCTLALRSSEGNIISLLHAVNRWLQALSLDDSTEQSKFQFWSGMSHKISLIFKKLALLHRWHIEFRAATQNASYQEKKYESRFVMAFLTRNHRIGMGECSPAVESAYKAIIQQLLVMVQSNKRLDPRPTAQFLNSDKGEELAIEIERRILMLSGAYNYLKQTVRKESDGDLSNIINYFKNIEKYLSFDSGVVISRDRMPPLLFKMLLSVTRQEPSLIYSAELEPDLPFVEELQMELDKSCWDFMRKVDEENWKQYYRIRQNYFCYLLKYHDANLEKRVVLFPSKASPEVLDGSVDPDCRVEVFLSDLHNPGEGMVPLIRMNKNCMQRNLKELPRKLVLTWEEDFSIDSMKSVLKITENASLNSLLGLISYSDNYLQAFLTIIIEKWDQQILHSGCSWSLIILIKRHMPLVLLSIMKNIELFFLTMKSSINSLVSYGIMEVYINEFRSQPYEVIEKDTDKAVWKAGLVKLEETLKERYKAEWIFNDYFSSENDEKYFKNQRKELLRHYMKNFPYVLFLVFLENLNYFFAIENMHPITSRTVYRMKRLLHQSAYLREQFYNKDFQPIFRNIALGYWEVSQINGIIPSQFKYMISLFMDKWPELHAKELIGNTTLEQYNMTDVDIVKTLHTGPKSDVHVVNVYNYVSEVVAKKYHNKDSYFCLSENLSRLMRMQSHPHILRVYGYLVEDDNYIGILMEYCSGGSLLQVLEGDDDYGETDIIRWAGQAASGLLFLHQNKIIYGNLTPSKMLLNHSKKTLKVGGFSRYAYDRENSRLSVTLNKQYYNETSDLLSLGKSIQDVILRKPPHVAISVSKDFTKICESMLNKNDEERSSLAEIFQKLKQLRNFHY